MTNDNMITEDYVDFETAKKLKEKGFPIEIIHISGLENFPCTYLTPPKDCTVWANDTGMKLPTLYLVQKWLREEKNFFLNVGVFRDYPDNKHTYTYNISPDFKQWTQKFYEFNTYEEALQAGITKALELI